MIGKRGKTAIAIDTIINQRDLNNNLEPSRQLVCILCCYWSKKVNRFAINNNINGGKRFFIILLLLLQRRLMPLLCNLLRHMQVVQWVSFFRDNGRHALIIYDDLSKQAVALSPNVFAFTKAARKGGLSR